MRDDLSDLFRRLIIFYKEKLRILEEISGNEIRLRFFLQSDKIHEIYNIIQADNDLFIKISSVEFDIQSLITDICKTAGIEKNDFNIYFLNKHEEPLPELKRLKEKTNKHIAELIKERGGLITNMEKKLAELKIDINTLNSLIRLIL